MNKKKVFEIGSLIFLVLIVSISGCISETETEKKLIFTKEVENTNLTDDNVITLTPNNSIIITDGIYTVNITNKGELLVSEREYLTTYTIEYLSDQTNTTILTPNPHKRLDIHAIYVSTEDKLDDIELIFNETGKQVFRLFTDINLLTSNPMIHIYGEINESLLVSCGTRTFLAITYHEIENNIYNDY